MVIGLIHQFPGVAGDNAICEYDLLSIYNNHGLHAIFQLLHALKLLTSGSTGTGLYLRFPTEIKAFIQVRFSKHERDPKVRSYG
jgi:hypothetical protein